MDNYNQYIKLMTNTEALINLIMLCGFFERFFNRESMQEFLNNPLMICFSAYLYITCYGIFAEVLINFISPVYSFKIIIFMLFSLYLIYLLKRGVTLLLRG